MSKTCAYRIIERRTAIVVVGAAPPSDADWTHLADMMAKNLHDRAVVLSLGGGPSAKQRKQLMDASGGRAANIPCAILTESVMVRGITTAISWFVPEVRSFRPDELEAALGYLKITTPPADVRKVIEELRLELGPNARVARAS